MLEQLIKAMSSTLAKGLAVLKGVEIIYLDKFDSPLPVAAYSRIGGCVPACRVAAGKALQAEQLSTGTRDASQTLGYHPKDDTISPRSFTINGIHP